MPHPFTAIDEQIKTYFPPDTHPYRILERRIQDALKPTDSLLDIGCGRTAPTLRMYEGSAAKLYGIDIVKFEHPGGNFELLNESITDMHSIESNSINVAYSRSVMEHIDEAEAAFAETYRVLAPGGRYVFLTANKYDYASLVAAAVPNKLHPMIVRFSEGRDEIDTFPTCYKANSRRDIDRLCQDSGLTVDRFERLAQYPNYFNFSRMLFWGASQYERLIRSSNKLAVLRGWILCEVVKPAAGGG